MKQYIKPQIILHQVNIKNTLLAGSPQLNDKYISSNKDLSKKGYDFEDDFDEE